MTDETTERRPVSLRELVRRADHYLDPRRTDDDRSNPAADLNDADELVLHCLIMGQTPEEVDDYVRRFEGFRVRLMQLHVEGRVPAQVPGDPHCPVCLGGLRPDGACELCALEAHLRATGFE